MSGSSSRNSNAALACALRTILSPLDSPTTEAWCGEVMRHLRKLVGADAAGLTLATSGRRVSFGLDLDPKAIEAYDREYHLHDTGYQRRAELGLAAWTTDMLWQPGELRASRYWNEFKVPFRLYDAVGLTEERDGRLCAELFFHRDDPGRRFGDAAYQMAALLLPALRAAVDALGYTSESRQRFAGLFDSVSDGVLVFDFEGRLLHRNRAAASLLEQEGPLDLLSQASRCALALAEQYRNPVAAMRSGSTTPLVTEARCGSGRFRLSASAVERSGFCSGMAAVVTIARSTPLDSVEDLRGRFQLTDREVAVVRLLTEGRSNTEVAITLDISPHTARHHTQRVLEKLGVRSRAEVPRLLLHALDADVTHSARRD